MSEYIKREDAIDAVGRVDTAHFKLKGKPMLGACALIDEINDIPSVDVIEIGKPYRKEILEKYHLEEWIDEEGIIWAKVAKEQEHENRSN